MSSVQFKNQFLAELNSNLTAIATTLTLKSGHGANFPIVATGEQKHFFVTVVNNAGSREIIKIIKRENGSDILTVGSSVADQTSGNVSGRAQEGTSALAITYTDDHLVELRLTAGIMQDLADRIATLEEYDHDLNGSELILDADGDTSIKASTDDRIDFKSNGVDRFYIQENYIIPFTDNVLTLGFDTNRFAYVYSVRAYFTYLYSEELYLHNGSAYILQGKDINVGLNRKLIEIGDWNMDSTDSVQVSHGLTASKIRNISGVIRNDSNNGFYPLNYGLVGGAPYTQINCAVITTYISLQRLSGGAFDNSNFDSTSFNRGWIIIDYEN